MKEEVIVNSLKEVQIFTEDGRRPLKELYQEYLRLEMDFGWIKEVVYTALFKSQEGEIEVPVFCFKSPQQGPALWILSGVHGEEPAGPNAIANHIDELAKLAEEIPLVIMPLLNPLGYGKGWRYPDEYRDWQKGHSVSDSEYYLQSSADTTTPRASEPSSEFAGSVTSFVLKTVSDYPPILTIDHHEDEALEQSYIYSQGTLGADDPTAQSVVLILTETGIPLQMTGLTRFGELVLNGVAVDINTRLPVSDGSIDELLAAKSIIMDGQVVRGPSSKTSLVIETPTINVSLERRVQAHSNILLNLRKLWQIASTI